MKIKYHWLNHLFNFLAVILGVYLAFYINEAAKSKQEVRESVYMMNALLSDLSDDIKVYESYQIPANKQQQASLQQVLEGLMSDPPVLQGEQLTQVLQLENYAPTTSTYSAMRSSGKLGYIQDLSLQRALNSFYEGLATESVRKGEAQADYLLQDLLSWLTINLDLIDMKVLQKDALIVLRNKLLIYDSLLDQKVKAYEEVVTSSEALKTQIEAVLAAQ